MQTALRRRSVASTHVIPRTTIGASSPNLKISAKHTHRFASPNGSCFAKRPPQGIPVYLLVVFKTL